MDLDAVIRQYGTTVDGGYATVNLNIDGTVASKFVYADAAKTIAIYTKNYTWNLDGTLASWTVVVASTGEVFNGSDLTSDDINDLLAHTTATNPHPQYATGASEVVINYGDPQPVNAFTIPSNKRILSIDVHVLQAFNGVGASVIVGTPAQPNLFFDTGDTELDVADQFFSKDFAELGPLTVQVTVNPGTSPTSGQILVTITTSTLP